MPGKKPEEIRPAKGAVKIKQKKLEKKEVVQNVEQDRPGQELPPPTEEAGRVVAELNKLNQEFILLARDFNKLVNDSVLPENKTETSKDHEREVINKLSQTAIKIENLSPASGLLSLSILNLRYVLSLRDAGNKLARKIHILENSKQNLLENIASKEEALKYIDELKKKFNIEE